MTSVNFQTAPLPIFAVQPLLPMAGRGTASQYSTSEPAGAALAQMRVGGMPTGRVLRFAESSEIVVRMMSGRSGGGIRSGGGEAPPPSGGGDGSGRGAKKARRGASSMADISPVPQIPRKSISLITDPEVYELAKNLCESPSARVRLDAALTIAKMDEGRARQAEWAIIPRLITEDDPMIKAALMSCAVLVQGYNTAWYVADSLSHDVDAVRAAAAIALSEMGHYASANGLAGGDVIPKKLRKLEKSDGSEKVRAAAAIALEKLGI